MARYSAVPADISGLYTNGATRFDSRQVGQMLYQEQKMREQKALQEDAAVSKMLQDDVGKVRSADVGLVTDMYGKVKGAKMSLMDPKIKSNPQLYAQAQQAHLRAMNDYYTTVRGSVEEKEKDKSLTTLKPDERADDYGNFMATRIKTPLNQLQGVQYNGRQVDLSNPDTFRYMGSNTDFSKILRDVSGTPRQVYAETKPLDKIGLQSEITPYFYGNSPAQVYSGLMGAFSQRGAGRDAALQWDALPKEQYEAVRQAYKNMPADRLKRMGLEKPQELSEYNPDNKAENFARFKAMEYALNNEPEKRTPTYKTNEAVKMQKDQEFQRGQMQQRFNNAKALIASKAKPTGSDAQSVLNGMVSDLISEAKKHPVTISNADGTKTQTYDIPVTEEVAKAVMLPGESAPNSVRYVEKDGQPYVQKINYQPTLSADGKTITGYATGKNGKPIIDVGASRMIPLKQFRDKLGKEMYTGKILYTEQGQPMNIEDVDFGDGEIISIPSSPSKPSIPIKKVEELRNKYGY
jgi:hypothetical protein